MFLFVFPLDLKISRKKKSGKRKMALTNEIEFRQSFY